MKVAKGVPRQEY